MLKYKKSILSLASTLLSITIIGCGYDNDGKNVVDEDRLISVTPLFDINSSMMQTVVNQLAPGHPAFGIKGYRVVYKTKDDKGKDIKASGLITVPVASKLILDGLKKKGKNFSISIVSDQHGTIFPDSQAPTSSVILSKKPTDIATLFSAVGGFMTIQPDYIGFGESKGKVHPYLLEDLSASTVIDLLKSAIKFADENSFPINGQIFLSGYSEGGYVTLAAQDEIEKNHPELHLTGVSAMSGPYDLNLTGLGVVSQAQIGRVDFVGGIINSYAKAYDLNLSQIVQEQYASKFPTLYDATKTATQIQEELTDDTNSFLVPSFRADFLQNPNNKLRKEFVENSVDDFKPKTPTELLYCAGDKTVDPRIALSASKKMGVDAIDLNSSLNHTQCAFPAYLFTLKYFDELRSK